MRPPSRRIVPAMQVTNGSINLHVAEDGDPSAPPILLLHGITSFGRTWDWIVPELAERFPSAPPRLPRPRAVRPCPG